jgi:hypothetical protein
VELRGEYVEKIYFFNPVACCFIYKAKELSVPLVFTSVRTLIGCPSGSVNLDLVLDERNIIAFLHAVIQNNHIWSRVLVPAPGREHSLLISVN